jgi:hypothetical protein
LGEEFSLDSSFHRTFTFGRDAILRRVSGG